MSFPNKEEIIDYLIRCPKDSKVYLGGDSLRHKKYGKWWAKYSVVLVVHISGNSGGKIFSFIEEELDYDQHKNRPKIRLMNEAIKIANAYLDLKEILLGWDVEIHLDLNPKKEYNSSEVVKQASGYVLGVTQIEPKIKPDSWCGSCVADHIGRKN